MAEGCELMHVWDFPPRSTYLLLDENFQRNLMERSIEKMCGMRALADFLNEASVKYGASAHYGASNTCDWKLGRKVQGKRNRIWIPLWVTLELGALAPEQVGSKRFLFELEGNVLSYKECENGKPIDSPALPIRVTPEFDSLVFHLLGDGCWGGKGKLASYRQKNKEGRENFVRKLTNVFGNFEINRYECDEEWKVCIPSILARIIEKHYSMESCSPRRIPPQILKKGNEFKLAGLLAFIVDEGHVGDSIEIYSSNKCVLEDLHLICNELQYDCSDVKLKAKAGHQKHKLDHYRLRIHFSAVETLLSDIETLSRSFPTCTLSQKQKSLELLVERRKLKRGKGKDNMTKETILKELSEGPKTAKYFKETLLIGGQTIREHLNCLEKKGLIGRREKIQNADLWSIAQKSESRL